MQILDSVKIYKKYVLLIKLDGVGPVDNRLSID